MDKVKKNIKSEVVKESIAELEDLQNTVQANAEETLKSLLEASVRKQFDKAINEAAKDDEPDKAEEDEKDSNADEEPEEIEEPVEGENDDEGDDDDAKDDETNSDNDDDDATKDETPEDSDDEAKAEDEEGEPDEWAPFDKYKVDGEDGTYDATNASKEDTIKMFKLMDDNDVIVKKINKDTTVVKDNQSGAEYVITMDDDDDDVDDVDDDEIDVADDDDDKEFEIELGESEDDDEDNEMLESLNLLPGKNVSKNGGEKELRYGKTKGKTTPFVKHSQKKLEEGEGMAMSLIRHKTKKPHLPHVEDNGIDESKFNKVIAQVKAIKEENEELKKALSLFRTKINEHAVLNCNLAKIVKLFMENATTADEKKEIVERFDREATTMEASQRLYESINAHLKSAKSINENTIAPDVQVMVGSKGEPSKTVKEKVLFESPEEKRFFQLLK